YYVCASDLYGWNASNVYYLVSDNIYGPYTPTNNMLKMPGAENDYGHVTQTGFFYTVKGTEEETVIYCGDRWAGFAGNGNGFNQWCPISFVNDKPYFNSLSHWMLNAETGEWKVGKNNNYVRNFSFDADRIKIPSTNKPAQTYLKGWSFKVKKGNAIVQGGANSPQLNASNTSSDRSSVMGNWCLNIYDKVDYTRTVYQTISSTPVVELTDGMYSMEAMVRCGSEYKELYMYAKCNGETYRKDVTSSDGKWRKIRIDDIMVKGGKVEIGFYADGAAGAWCRIDDVSFIRKADLADAIQAVKDGGLYNGNSAIYSLDGIKREALTKGVNVVRTVSDGIVTTKKVWVK
ncbi:MAG: hypothetical protein K6E54_01455, partial [Bacteroidaceae bacterium]|nr:hypothetical protein [Bacteroidaceae bacterium]